jgi:hypothetical protein
MYSNRRPLEEEEEDEEGVKVLTSATFESFLFSSGRALNEKPIASQLC